MNGQATQPRTITSAAALSAGTIAGVIVVAATAVALAGRADHARAALGLEFAGLEPSLRTAAGIAIDNARIVAATLLCAWRVPRLARPTRRLVDCALATVLAVNATIVGLAAGAYGTRVLRATALHLPFELSALALAAGAYIHARERPLTPRALACSASASGALLLVAALLETYASPGIQR